MEETRESVKCFNTIQTTKHLGVEEDLVLAGAPRCLLDRRIEVVEPALAALLAEPPGKELGDIAPLENLGYGETAR